jgi:hypothetical protein
VNHRAARSAAALVLAMSAATVAGTSTLGESTARASTAGASAGAASAGAAPAGAAPASPSGSATTAAGSGSAAAPTQDPTLPIQLEQVRVLPAAPRPHEMLHISGVARAAMPFTHISVRLRVQDSVIHSRDELHADAADNSRLVDSTVAVSQAMPDIAPGTDTAWSTDVPVDGLHLAFGVHRISIVVYDATLTQLGRVNTFLPYLPAGNYQPTNVAWVWPLVDAPRRDATTTAVQPAAGGSPSPTVRPAAPPASSASAPVPDASGSPSGTPAAPTGDTFLDDTLADSLGAGGRLGQLVKAAADAATQHGLVPPATARPPASVPGPRARPPAKPPTVQPLPKVPVPVTWAIDPDLLESAKAMTGGYLVRTPAGLRPGSAVGAQNASRWLSSVTAAVGNSPIIPLPYADADIVALARAGHSDEVRYSLLVGRGADGIFRQVLSRDVTPSIVWPVDGLITQDALDVVASAQASSVLLDEAALPLSPFADLAATPSMQGPPLSAGGGTVQPLVADTTLDQLLAADPTAADQGLAVQRFLAETAMITAEAPSRSRDILLLPPRQASSTAYLGKLLLLTGQVPWLNGISLDDALRHPVDPAPRATLTYPDSARRQEVSRGLINATSASRARLDLLRSILTQPEVLDPTERGLLRTYSASWRRDSALATQVRAGADALVTDYLGKVTVVHGRDPVTLLSKSAKIPLTISNGLDQRVHDIRVQVHADNPANLEQVYADHIDIPAHDKTQRELDARVPNIGSVRFGVVVDLIAANGKGGLLSSVPLQVHSTGAGGTVLMVTWVLTTLLFLVVAIRLVLRVRRYYTGRSHPAPVASAD